MSASNKFFLVDITVLPEVFFKVVQAKKLLAQGKAKNLSEATKLVDISRSAFYKYKNSVFEYDDTGTRQITTFYAQLVDEPGILSSLLSMLSQNGANILTINQNIPVDGVAPVSISIRTDECKHDITGILKQIAALSGVVSIKKLSN